MGEDLERMTRPDRREGRALINFNEILVCRFASLSVKSLFGVF